MDDTAPKAKYLVLNNAISAAFKERLLGCVVNDVVDPANGFQPFFDADSEDGPSDPSELADYDRLKSTMKAFLMKNTDANADPTNKEKFKNQVDLKDLLTEKRVEGDVSVDGSLTKLLRAHYGSHEERNFEIEAATGKRYHLHNAVYEFKNRLWSNKYYRDRIYDVIEQKRDDGTLETLNKFSRKYSTSKSTRHKCEVIILPMIVGILTCEEIKVNIVDNTDRQHGAAAALPVDQLAGLPTGNALDLNLGYEAGKIHGNRTAETIPDEVIVALAYDLIAIPTGRPDPNESISSAQAPRESRGFFSKMLGLGSDRSPHPCETCATNRLSYAAAWRHTAIRTSTNRGANIHMTPHSVSPSLLPQHPDAEYPEDATETVPDLADATVELYVAPHSDHYVLAEDLDPRLSPSSTGSSTRSAAGVVRINGQIVPSIEGLKLTERED